MSSRTQRGNSIAILVVKDGNMIEQGTHKELLEKGEKYARMFHLQSKYYQQAEAGLFSVTKRIARKNKCSFSRLFSDSSVTIAEDKKSPMYGLAASKTARKTVTGKSNGTCPAGKRFFVCVFCNCDFHCSGY